jgi:hypothetical protein
MSKEFFISVRVLSGGPTMPYSTNHE